MKVRCPDCGEEIQVPPGVTSEHLLDCPNCAGHALRIREVGGHWTTTLAFRVSCPDCDVALTLPEDVKAGDMIECCEQRYRLTFEYGAYAAERL